MNIKNMKNYGSFPLDETKKGGRSKTFKLGSLLGSYVSMLVLSTILYFILSRVGILPQYVTYVMMVSTLAVLYTVYRILKFIR